MAMVAMALDFHSNSHGPSITAARRLLIHTQQRQSPAAHGDLRRRRLLDSGSDDHSRVLMDEPRKQSPADHGDRRRRLLASGGQSYTFSLKLRYGGRITLCNPPKYLGGKVTTFSDMDSDEWGIMTLREKVVELGFNKDDNLRYFSLGEKGVFEFMTDLETWNLVNNVVRPKVVEIWAILGGTGDDADVAEDANTDSDEEGEGVGGRSDGSDWEEGESANELEEFEGSEYENDKGDDQEFAKHVDPQVEYGGVQVPTNVEAEMHVEGEMQVDPQAADALNMSDDGA
nr:uncharacterized protein LOC109184816 [Ipomoea batatas]